MNILKRHSFWVRVIQSGQIILGTVQGITLATEDDIKYWNIIIAGIQAGLGILSLWTADTNKNDIIDIAEPKIDITVTSSTPVNVTTETREP